MGMIDVTGVFKKTILFFLTLVLMYPSLAYSAEKVAAEKDSQSIAPSYESLRETYVPQYTPEESYRLELKLLSTGYYCYDLPLFDEAWRKKGPRVLESAVFVQTWKDSNHPILAEVNGDQAVVYYPEHFDLTPVFLEKKNGGWVIDHTVTQELVVLTKDFWVALDVKSPYFSILSDIFKMERTEIAKGRWGYRPVKLNPSPAY